MRLDTAREETITNLNGSHKFTMNATAKAFQILSSGIYERKEEAIVRELSCNAYDSHVQAGKKDVPFRVQLPTPVNDFIFAVEDFGVGLSEDEVYNVYTTYFESTKTDSNDVIGALGLGSKTPFSYTDSFTVKARKDGKECVFSAQISASGEPEVVKMYDRPWTGQNGVEVSVEIASKDVSTFYSAASKVLSWFTVKPLCNRDIAFDISEDVVANVREYGYHLEATNGWGRSARSKVVMGNVAYDLDLSDLKADGRTDVGQFVDTLYGMNANLYFEVEIGEADVAASRETLSLDERTRANLLDKLDGIRVNFKKTTEDKMQGFKNIHEAYRVLTPYERKIVHDIEVNGFTLAERSQDCYSVLQYDRNGNMSDEDKEIQELIVDNYDIAFYGDWTSRYTPKKRHQRNSVCNFSKLMMPKFGEKTEDVVTVVVNDCERKIGLKDAVMNNDKLPEYVMVVSDKNTVVNADLKKILNRLTFGGYKIILASSFWDGKLSPHKKSTGGLADTVVKAQVLKSTRSIFSYQTVDFSVEDTGRWLYGRYDGDGDVIVTFNGRMSYVNRFTLSKLMEEFDIDGIVGTNAQNCKKVERIFGDDSRSIEKFLLEHSSKEDSVNLAKREALRLNHEEQYKIFDSYQELVDTIKGLEVKSQLCSQIVYGQCDDTFTETNRALKLRMKVYETAIRIYKESSPVLAKLLTPMNFSVSMIPEIKMLIEAKKGGK